MVNRPYYLVVYTAIISRCLFTLPTPHIWGIRCANL